MAALGPEARCAYCGKALQRSEGGGRPRDYCGVPCRRRAQRRRDHGRGGSMPPRDAWDAIVADLAARARELRAIHIEQLAAALELAEGIREDADCLAAVAVDAARHRGRTWGEIAPELGVSEASARARWGGVRVSRMVAARVPRVPTQPTYPAHPKAPRPPSRATPGQRSASPEAGAAVEALGTALRDLGEALRGAQQAARHIEVTAGSLPHSDAADLRALVEGRAVPDWPPLRDLLIGLGVEPKRPGPSDEATRAGRPVTGEEEDRS
ncbi:hypothetical protein [Streptomyces sp. NPDC057702]|uniref:hypothetical protein n=1 Tax=unclassified Streptomyces TaxID=2593676 RepID=UPI0036A5F0F8